MRPRKPVLPLVVALLIWPGGSSPAPGEERELTVRNETPTLIGVKLQRLGEPTSEEFRLPVSGQRTLRGWRSGKVRITASANGRESSALFHADAVIRVIVGPDRRAGRYRFEFVAEQRPARATRTGQSSSWR